MNRIRGVVAGALAIAACVAFAPPSSAVAQKRDSSCEVRVAGKRFVNGSHIKLRSNRSALIAVTAAEERPRYKVAIELAGQRSTVGTGRGREFGWRRALDVNNSSTYGIGTYRLHVNTQVGRRTCAVTGLIDVTGRSPLTTVAGGLSALLALVGAAVVFIGFVRRGGRPLRTRHAFVVDNPLGQFVAVDTPGNYVGWAEVACDVGARTFLTAKTTATDVREFMRHDGTRARLNDLRAKGVRVRLPDGDTPAVPRLRWRPRFYVLSSLLGLVAGLGVIGYLQQSAALYLTEIDIAIAAAVGFVAGLVIANLSRLFAVVGLNRRLKEAETGLDEEDVVEPRYPPIDHLDELDTFVWTPTHTVPDNGDGLPAWAEPDRDKDRAATLDPGLPVRVVERRDGLAQVVCSNGWVGWTDAESLEELES
jgi:hypothetical protein